MYLPLLIYLLYTLIPEYFTQEAEIRKLTGAHSRYRRRAQIHPVLIVAVIAAAVLAVVPEAVDRPAAEAAAVVVAVFLYRSW